MLIIVHKSYFKVRNTNNFNLSGDFGMVLDFTENCSALVLPKSGPLN